MLECVQESKKGGSCETSVAWVTRLESGHDYLFNIRIRKYDSKQPESESKIASFYEFESVLSWNHENFLTQAVCESLLFKMAAFLEWTSSTSQHDS